MRFMKTTIFVAISLILTGVLYYFWLPPLNLSAPGFWFFAFIAVLTVSGAIALSVFAEGDDLEDSIAAPIITILIIASIAIPLIGEIGSATCFHAKKNANLLEVTNTTFESEFENVDWNTIPHIDNDSAKILGARKMGTLVEEVSQYNVSNYYTLINHNGKPVRIAPLEYAGIFKYFNNKANGIPGYIIVDCVEKDAEFVKLDKGIQYSDSACFSKDLDRHLRFSYPTKLFDDLGFEIDDKGNPYWVVPTYKYSIGIGGGKTPDGCIICDPVTGETKFYNLNEIPTWVDHAVDDYTIVSLVNKWGKYQSGFKNYMFGQKNVRMSTEGSAFITMNDDVYLYTGITSVAMDESNIGFILVNQRTAEAKYFEMPSAEEYSAMDSAKGQVQHLAYSSTFPVLINFEGHPTYFLSLKDDAGLVKMYSMVSVEDIQKLAVTESSEGIEKLIEEYSKILKIAPKEEPKPEVKYQTTTIEITNIYSVVVGGNTQFYFEDTKGNVFMTDITKSVKLPVFKIGDKIKVKYSETDVKNYYNIASVE